MFKSQGLCAVFNFLMWLLLRYSLREAFMPMAGTASYLRVSYNVAQVEKETQHLDCDSIKIKHWRWWLSGKYRRKNRGVTAGRIRSKFCCELRSGLVGAFEKIRTYVRLEKHLSTIEQDSPTLRVRLSCPPELCPQFLVELKEKKSKWMSILTALPS